MPQCHRCERVLPTAELRRTKRGYLCKDNGKRHGYLTRCEQIFRELRERRQAA